LEYYFDSPGLIHACASVGIERGLSTGEMLGRVLDAYHLRGHKAPAVGDLQDALREEVKAALQAAGLTQAQVARSLDVSPKHVNQMLSGKAVLTLEWAERIADLCGRQVRVSITRTQYNRRFREALARAAELEQRVAALERWMSEAVWIDPGRMQGAPCLGGHRIPVSSVMSFLEGETGGEETAMLAYPQLTVEQVRLARWYHDRYAGQDCTCRWPRPVIHVDPAVAFGRPMVAGAPVASVAGRILAGEPLEEVAEDFGLNRRQALVACWWAGSQDEDFTDWWARWADEAGAALATADDGDTVCQHIPDPPSMTKEI
jgi:uncharacterized protein (DUF433 family)/plasmid maintenance system antidote protein VapI